MEFSKCSEMAITPFQILKLSKKFFEKLFQAGQEPFVDSSLINTWLLRPWHPVISLKNEKLRVE